MHHVHCVSVIVCVWSSEYLYKDDKSKNNFDRCSGRQHQPGVNLRHVVALKGGLHGWTGPVGLRAFSFLGGLSLPGERGGRLVLEMESLGGNGY